MEKIDVEQLLSDTNRSLIEIYLDLQCLFEKRYGRDTIVLMEVGSFFEVYGVDNVHKQIGKPKEVAEVLNIQLTRKNKIIKENSVKNPLMAGFPSAAFDRYVQKLVHEKRYTIVIIRQKGSSPNVTRYLDRILSPGVNFEYSLNNDANFIASIIIEKHRDQYSAGYASVDVTTGKTHVFEIHSTAEDQTYALDQMFSLMKTHQTTEVILTCSGSDIDQEEVQQYLELHEDRHVHINVHRPSIAYQNELFKQTYLVSSFLSPIEFLDLEKNPMASEAFALLLEFVIEHDHQVVQKLDKPNILDDKTFLYLGNNPLEQLNIVSQNPHESTVLELVDHTRTSVGRRLLRERLLNPIIDKKELENRYDLSDALKDHYEEIDAELKHVYDLDRIRRRIQLGRLHPFELNFLYDSLQAADRIIEHIFTFDRSNLFLDLLDQQATLREFITVLEETFVLDETTKYGVTDISQSFFQTGFHQELDQYISQKKLLYEKLETIQTEIVNLIEQQTGKPERDYVVIRQLDKEGHHISITKSRYFLIEHLLDEAFISLDGTVYSLGDFSIKVQRGNVKISADIIETTSEQLVVLDKKILSLVKELYDAELQKIDHRYQALIKIITEGLSKIDVALSNIKASIGLNLTRPQILDPSDSSYVELLSLRHPLVEAREENGIYVPNDVVMGDTSLQDDISTRALTAQIIDDDVRGVLLYGINSSGKSSLMKSIGVAVVLAQSGLFVPAERMRFTLFTELFTRIVAQDNFEKGLSSFAVEMLELKNVFNRATPRSLILGDEISHGTETLSALAIVGATVQRLSDLRSIFLFTTHLHQLHHLNILDNVKHVVSVHMHVRYDEIEDKLLFERTLQEGSGSSIYGLEFAQSLHMDETFLKLATRIRKEIAHEQENIELLTKKQTSIYNKQLFVTTCALCGDSVSDVHHIRHQKEADAHGNIENFHKNHKYNLVPLCKSCHDDVHTNKVKINGFKMTSQGLELDVDANYHDSSWIDKNV